MKLVFSHTTALHLLRVWSRNHPLPLRAFHDLRPRDVRHLPASNLKGSSSLSDAVDTESAAHALIPAARKPSLHQLLEKLWDSTNPEMPIHGLAQPKKGRHPSHRVVFHQVAPALPHSSFLEIAPGIAVCSPELVFIQMAEALSLGELIALGYELCGCYPLDLDRPGALVRSPLTTPMRLAAFVKRACRLKGLRKARVAAQFVRAKSASPMETEVSALLMTPMKWGGLGLPSARANEPVYLSDKASRIARGNRIVCDLLWDEAHVVVEYDGRASHAGNQQQTRDSRRRDAMAADGIEVVTITSSQVSGVFEFFEIADTITRKLGRRPRKRTAEFTERHMELRRELRTYRSEYFPYPSESESA